MGLIIVASFIHTNQEPAWQIVASFQTKGAADKHAHKNTKNISTFAQRLLLQYQWEVDIKKRLLTAAKSAHKWCRGEHNLQAALH